MLGFTAILGLFKGKSIKYLMAGMGALVIIALGWIALHKYTKAIENAYAYEKQVRLLEEERKVIEAKNQAKVSILEAKLKAVIKHKDRLLWESNDLKNKLNELALVKPKDDKKASQVFLKALEIIEDREKNYD